MKRRQTDLESENARGAGNKKNVLILGMAGGLAQILAKILLSETTNFTIYGVDTRKLDHIEERDRLTLHKMKYSRGNFEKLFRENQFDYVFHLARLSHSKLSSDGLIKRLELSVMGTSRILDLCLRFKVKKVVVLSTFHVYGALADNPVFINENSPLKASMNYPELRDVVEMDQICMNWMYRYRDEMETVLMRPCNIIGPKIQNTMTKFLNSYLTLSPIDYNPMFQFIHEFDMASILYQSIEHVPSGVYNISPNEFISLRNAIKLTASNALPFPIFLASKVNKIFKTVPDYLIDYLKYSCLISNKNIRKYLGDDFYRFKIEETIKLSSF